MTMTTSVLEVDVGEGESGRFPRAKSGVDEQTDERRVTSAYEVAAVARLQQLAQVVVVHDRDGRLRDVRRLHVRHWRGRALPFLDAPREEHAERHVPLVAGGRAAALLGEVGEPGLDVFALHVGGDHRHPVRDEEVDELPEAIA